jgi:hypothetical protein
MLHKQMDTDILSLHDSCSLDYDAVYCNKHQVLWNSVLLFIRIYSDTTIKTTNQSGIKYVITQMLYETGLSLLTIQKQECQKRYSVCSEKL